MPLLPTLEAELRRAGQARLAARAAAPAGRPRRARRHRRVAALTGAIVSITLAAGVGVAAITGTPIDHLLQSRQDFGQQPGTATAHLSVRDPSGLRWSVVGYVARNGLVSTTTAADGVDRMPGTGGGAPELIAMARSQGDYVSVSTSDTRTGRELHRFVSGLADGDVTRVDVTLGGHRRRATLSKEQLHLSNGLVERVYGAGFVLPCPRRHMRIAPIRFDVTLKDGRTQTNWSPPQCIGACGGSIPTLPGP